MKTIAMALLLACSAHPSPPRRAALGCGPCDAHADGFERVRVHVVLRDERGAPLAGVRVAIGEEQVSTDAEGIAAAALASTEAGERAIPVRIGAEELGSVAVTFRAGSFPRAAGDLTVR